MPNRGTAKPMPHSRVGGNPLARGLGGVGEGFGVHLVVVIGQYRACLTWPVGERATADFAARDRKLRNCHRKLL
jgi:hypothetical protein